MNKPMCSMTELAYVELEKELTRKAKRTDEKAKKLAENVAKNMASMVENFSDTTPSQWDSYVRDVTEVARLAQKAETAREALNDLRYCATNF